MLASIPPGGQRFSTPRPSLAGKGICMRIHRTTDTKNVTKLPTALLQDTRLSYGARGLLAEILSDPDEWDGTADSIWLLAKERRGERGGEGRRVIRAMLRELEVNGYLIRRRLHGPGGLFHTYMEISDVARQEVMDEVKEQTFPLAVTGPSGPRSAYVYRHWDVDDRLLYIGITVNLRSRERGHAKSSRWMAFHARTTAVRFASEPTAAKAEWDSIADEQPIFNLDGNDTPEARRRRADYLAENKRAEKYLEPIQSDDYRVLQAWWRSAQQRIADVLGGYASPREERAVAAAISRGDHPRKILKTVLLVRGDAALLDALDESGPERGPGYGIWGTPAPVGDASQDLAS